MNEWLLDTGVLLWWLSSDPRLSSVVRCRITQSATRVYVSVATAWEISSLARQGRVDLGEPPGVCLIREVSLHRFLWLPLDARHVLRAQELPRGSLDPYDRLLVAQAALEGLSIVTSDPRLGGHGASIVEALERTALMAGRRPRLEPGRPIRMAGYRDEEVRVALLRAAVKAGELPPTALNAKPLPRPVRRSGDELEGEADADPTEPRTLANPAGLVEGEAGPPAGRPDALSDALSDARPDAGPVEGEAALSDGRSGALSDARPDAGLAEADADADLLLGFGDLEPRPWERGWRPKPSEPTGAYDTSGSGVPGAEGDPDVEGGAAGPGSAARDAPEPLDESNSAMGPPSVSDIVVRRSIPRWNAFPWGGTFRGGGGG